MPNAIAKAAESNTGSEIALSVSRLSKRFPGVQALSDVSLDLHAGEVLGLVGENGAGKSTLIKIIAGVESADSGVVTLPYSASGDLSAGIAVIYQELAIVPAMSALSNVFLGDPPRKGPWLDRGLMERRFRDNIHRIKWKALNFFTLLGDDDRPDALQRRNLPIDMQHLRL